MEKYKGNIEMKAWTIVPILLYVSKSTIEGTTGSKTIIYSLHITPWLNLSFNVRKA